jgi:hypothetical protein
MSTKQTTLHVHTVWDYVRYALYVCVGTYQTSRNKNLRNQFFSY